jgi:hypothetical protein
VAGNRANPVAASGTGPCGVYGKVRRTTPFRGAVLPLAIAPEGAPHLPPCREPGSASRENSTRYLSRFRVACDHRQQPMGVGG